MVNVVFTGLYSENCVLPPQEKVNLIRSCGIENIYWVVWKGYVDYKVADYGVKIIEIEEPYPHVSSSIRGRQRQIFNTEAALKNFSDDDIVFEIFAHIPGTFGGGSCVVEDCSCHHLILLSFTDT